MQSTDFVPRIIQKDVAFSTLSLIGDIPGPKYELFSDLLTRVNDWLQERCDLVALVSCEVIDSEGVFSHAPNNHRHNHRNQQTESAMATRESNSNAVKSPTLSSNNSTPAFLKIIRIWTTDVKRSSSASATCRPAWSAGSRLTATEVLPRRLEAATGQRSPRFQRMSDCLAEFNQNNYICNDEVLCVRTTRCRFSSRHCVLDTQRLFWLAGCDLDDVHTCSYLLVFSVQNGSKCRDRLCLGYRDFTGDLSRTSSRKHSSAKRRQTRLTSGQCVQALCKRATTWTQRNDKVALVNLDTSDYCVNYKISSDKPSPERLCQLLDCPHVINSLRSTTYRTKVVRAFYQKSYKIPTKENIIYGCKIFHSPTVRKAVNIQFGAFYRDRHSLRGFDFDSIAYTKWMNENVDNIIGMETTKIVVSANDQRSPRSNSLTLTSSRSVDASDLSATSSNHYSNYVLFSLHVYTSEHCKDLQPQPKGFQLPQEACTIL